MRVSAIVIGRNEGQRLIACLASVSAQVDHVIYVDSGSTDGSQEAAQAAGAQLILLDTFAPFTAARARNAGLEALAAEGHTTPYVQFVDGDCILQEGWVARAVAFLEDHPKAAAVCGRRRERFPEASLYNWLTDLEWDTPVGQTRSCGGDVLMRHSAVEAVGRYNPTLIAGEEPELCVRLRAAGWSIWRIDAEMTWHDVQMHRFTQWWTRSKRAGHAFAEGAALHGAPPEQHNVAQTRRALIWGLGLPLVIIAGLFVTPYALALVLLWPLKVVRLIAKGTAPWHAAFLTLGNVPEAQGALMYYWKRLVGKENRLIDYKA